MSAANATGVDSGLTLLATVETASEAETAALAAHLAQRARRGDVLCLSGDLGSGKSCFARAFIRAVSRPDLEVPSPTFTLVQHYEIAGAAGFEAIWHVDLYRLNAPAEIAELGIDEGRDDVVMLVEWPERAPELFPDDRLEISFSLCDNPEARLIVLRGRASWANRLNDGLNDRLQAEAP